MVQCCLENEIESEKADAFLMARDWSETVTLSGVVFETPILWLVSVRFYLSV